ncbi:hypothetical protein OAF83_01915 [Rubripirellula sp.]|nr:hypothetical protein [Rubripirellula sp.]
MAENEQGPEESRGMMVNERGGYRKNWGLSEDKARKSAFEIRARLR